MASENASTRSNFQEGKEAKHTRTHTHTIEEPISNVMTCHEARYYSCNVVVSLLQVAMRTHFMKEAQSLSRGKSEKKK